MWRHLVFVAVLAMAAPAWADVQPSTGQGAPPAAQTPNPAARRCITDTTTGTRVPRRICRTNAEWAALADAARRQHQQDVGNRDGCHADRDTCTGQGDINAGT